MFNIILTLENINVKVMLKSNKNLHISILFITFASVKQINNDSIMKKLGNKFPSDKELKGMYRTIMSYIKGNCTPFAMTERARQYFTWGANAFKFIVDDSGLCYGIQFRVSGLIHKGRVRIYFNRASDYFDIELLRAIKDEVVYECEDLDFTQLHNVLHKHIERTDDPEV